MKTDALDGVKNVEFTGIKFCEELETELPVFRIVEETVEEWNAKARKQNTLMFLEAFGYSPQNYDEVVSWIHSLREEKVAV